MQGFVWNTVYNITYCSNLNLDDSIVAVLDGVGRSLSAFDTTSTLYRINRGDSIKSDRMLSEVYRLSMRMHEISEGAFDPTVGALVNAWGFGPEKRPDSVEVSKIMQYTGLKKTSLSNDGYIIRTDNRIRLDFAAIAKGYGADEVARMLLRNGVSDFIIEIGGEIVTHGVSPRGGDWKVGIDKPELQRDTIIHNTQAVLSVKEQAVATSGNYRNFYRLPTGKVIAHTIDPRTGYSCETDILSATVLAPTCAEADAMATACMVLGSKKAVSMLKKNGYGAYLVLSDGKVINF